MKPKKAKVLPAIALSVGKNEAEIIEQPNSGESIGTFAAYDAESDTTTYLRVYDGRRRPFSAAAPAKKQAASKGMTADDLNAIVELLAAKLGK